MAINQSFINGFRRIIHWKKRRYTPQREKRRKGSKMDFLNKDIKRYIGDEEKVELNETCSSAFLVWVKICKVFYAFLGLIIAIIVMEVRSPEGGLITFGIIAFVLWLSYLQLISERYVITDKKILILSGLLNKSIKDIPHSKITDSQITQSFFEKLFFESGTILLNTAGSDGYEISIKHVNNPFEVKKIVDKHIK